ncbi:MAG: peroxiredoxin [Proteobacteria bacterium]|nr:MAG: peroxiredoxin [Pseudomonadota bacterium]
MKRILVASLFASLMGLISGTASAADLKVGDQAPLFKAKDQTGGDFNLEDRKGKWTVLFFYPKAGTPGCTKQACAFRDNIKKITEQDAAVYGISADSVADQAKFHKEHRLNFTLIADPEDAIIKSYGTKMPLIGLSKRWTFILDPDLKIRMIEKDVDPVLDSTRTAEKLATLKKQKT